MKDKDVREKTEDAGHELGSDHSANIHTLRSRLRVSDSFDVIERHLSVAGHDVCFFFVDGFVKDGEMQRVMQHFLGLKELGDARSVQEKLPYVEVDLSSSLDDIVRGVLSGQSAVIGEGFGPSAILVDARTYPARGTSEPDTDRVMQGAHDGFVETLVVNTALIRRRIRDPRLTMRHFNLGGASATDVVMCYMDGVADKETVGAVAKKLSRLRPDTLTLGYQSLAESLIRHGWYNPFPKLRLTERPDTAASQLLEGSVLIICDTTPQVMIIPTSVFAFLEQTDDFYFPPLTGSYLRIVRTVILLLSVVITPLWYLAIEYSAILPPALLFLVPDDPGALPIILQLLLVEAAIDGLKIASMNTPDMLSNSLSVVGALLLGDFAVEIGWLCGDVILYMAFVAIANFAQQNVELGYAFKFMRVLTLIFVFGFGVWGLLIGFLLFIFLVATNTTVTGKRRYLYPLVPFNGKALASLLVRKKKSDVTSAEDGEGMRGG
ncbi:MAG: spore germination protein [Clostridia bacterium]|nr:spore germination protein [Clostridia bacterium]